MRILHKIIIPVIIFLFVEILFQFSFFSNLEHKVQDSFFRIRGTVPVSDSIVIVAIDNNTFQDLNLSWPFPRELQAKLISNLKKAGARQIIFDIEFTEYSNPNADAALTLAAKDAGNVIMAGKLIEDASHPHIQQLLPPIQPLLAECINWGLANMKVDGDGYLRGYELFKKFDDKPVYSLGIAALANRRVSRPDWEQGVKTGKGYLNVAGIRIPVVRGSQALINYYGPANTFKQISFSQVLDDYSLNTAGLDLNSYNELVEKGVFQDKIVLIGATIDELHDQFFTPFHSSLMSGVEIQANFLEMALNGHFLRYYSPWLLLFIELLACILIYLALVRWKPQYSLIITLGLIIVTLIISYLLFIGNAHLVEPLKFICMLTLIYVASLVSHYVKSQRDKRFIKNAFRQYMAPELVNELLKNPQNLKYGGSQQEITVLFSDIRSFTAYAERHKPEETVQILKEYFTAMVKTVIKNHGIVDKFVGDEIVALFGTPIPQEEHALQACQTALDMREELKRLQKNWLEQGRDIFDIGIGINSGTAIVGNLGSEQIFDYTAIGDTVNLGARLEALNKEVITQSKIIISATTYEKVKHVMDARFIDNVKIKGKELSVPVYELIGRKGEVQS
ncbi:MAG TPA: adenylate/guanylate cyclase domain-containing protein [Candidatus Cloacimonadota bacterium]|nr:adenylate/guanylate cyclase domain-containing protein [Candidatus Cloacimonadota bacterium]